MITLAQKRATSRSLSFPLKVSGARYRQRKHITAPSHVAHSPVTVTQTKTTNESPAVSISSAEKAKMRTYLRSRPVVMLPTPLPPRTTLALTQQHLQFFPDTPTLDKLSLMEACLAGFLDVQRAHQLFMDAIEDSKIRYQLDARVYNVFIRTYFEYAVHEEAAGHNAKNWRDRAWSFYDCMENETSHPDPNLATYAIMIRSLLKSPEMNTSEKEEKIKQIFRGVDKRSIQLSSIVNHALLEEPSDKIEVIQLLTSNSQHFGSRAVMAEKLAEVGVTETGIVDFLEGVPEVKTQQKKKFVKKEVDGVTVKTEVHETPYNLGVLRENLNQIIQGRKTLPDDVLQRQKQLEETAYDNALARFKHEAEVFRELDMGGNLNRRSLQAWMWDWHVATEPYLQQKIEEICSNPVVVKTRGAKAVQAPITDFLKLLPASKMTLIAILELTNMMAGQGYQDGIRTTRAVMTIGAAIEAEHHFQEAKKHDIPVLDFKSKADLPTYSVAGYLELHKERVKARLELEGRENWMPAWTPEVRARVGAFIVDALMEKSTVTLSKMVNDELYEEEQAAFYNTYRYEHGFKIGIIKVNDVIIEKMSQEPPRSTLHPRHLPMIARPRPWIRHNAGGYLYSNSSVMRMKECSEQNSYLKEADSRGAMELVYAGLDVLGKTAWKINKAVFDVALEAWNKGLEYPCMPGLELHQKIPTPPVDSTDLKAKADYAVALKKLAQEKGAHHSDRCSTNYKMEIARTFLGEKFYLPHNVDFRGRAYPIPPHLNHMGDDLSRGLLMFAEGKPLGKKGLRWLKIHLSNVFGYDKAPFDDRETFATEHLAEIYDSAENPLTGKQWWLKADDAWQCLATCIELRNALESPDPERYVSCFPVHQDGTCNGLQHYAALGGDVIGARQVNLDVSDRPSDVYTYVSDMAKSQVTKDAAEGNELAQQLIGKINRKLVKQTVMTTVYGVTFIGARDQIHKQLKANEEFNGIDLYPLANYLAKVTLDCIGTLFSGAKDIQIWLNNCARLISKSIPEDRVRLMLLADKDYQDLSPSERAAYAKKRLVEKKSGKEQMTTVIWTTLLGLPIVQPYRKTGRKQVMTQLQSVYITDPNQPQAVNTSKQVSAFPPNFVHSLDATHMMLTALQCDREGMTFAAVHDSYWTHAATIEDMSVAIRDAFIHLHSSNVLENLFTEFRARYADYKLPLEIFKSRSNVAAITKSNLPPEIKALIEQQARLAKEDNEEEEVDMEEESPEEPVKKTKSKKITMKDPARPRTKAELAAVEKAINEKYVNLIDVLPPLPEKGKFNIEVIKDSLYFFS
ncbi:DNA/RNA polymerase [Serendipita vermifera]|nr:DNA/RNA polymerase [Serendipita vermifera]